MLLIKDEERNLYFLKINKEEGRIIRTAIGNTKPAVYNDIEDAGDKSYSIYKLLLKAFPKESS